MLTRATFRGLKGTAMLTAVILAAACSPATENGPTAENDAAPAAATAQNDEWDDPAPAPRAEYSAPAPKPAPKPSRPKAPATANLPGGTEFEVMLVNELASNVALAGEPVEGRILDAVRVNGRTVIPAGTRVEGVISEVAKAKHIGGRAMVAVAWTGVILPGGGSLAIEGGLMAEAKGTTKKDTAIIAGSAVGGAILGKILGGDSKDAAIGAVLGGGVGTAVAAKRGDEAILIAETMGWVKTLASADLRIR
jgi:hypothetical protein